MALETVPASYEEWAIERRRFTYLVPYFHRELIRRNANIQILLCFCMQNAQRLAQALGLRGFSQAVGPLALLGYYPEHFAALDAHALALIYTFRNAEMDWTHDYKCLCTNPDDVVIESLPAIDFKTLPPVRDPCVGHHDQVLEAYLQTLTAEQCKGFYRAFRFEVRWRDPRQYTGVVTSNEYTYLKRYHTCMAGAGITRRQIEDLASAHLLKRREATVALEQFDLEIRNQYWMVMNDPIEEYIYGFSLT